MNFFVKSTLIGLWLLTIFPQSAPARTIKVGEFSISKAALTTDDTSENPHSKTVEKEEYQIYLPLPLPFPFLGGMLVPEFFAAEEKRNYQESTTSLRRLRVGAIFLPHAKEGAPRFYLKGYRHTHTYPHKNTTPLTELIIGSWIDNDDAAKFLRWPGGNEAETQLGINAKQIYSSRIFTPILGHKVTFRPFKLDLLYPYHALLTYNWESKSASVEYHKHDYLYPRFGSNHSWLIGNKEQWLTKISTAISEPMYISIFAGKERISEKTFSASGSLPSAKQQTNWYNVFGIGVSAWIDTRLKSMGAYEL